MLYRLVLTEALRLPQTDHEPRLPLDPEGHERKLTQRGVLAGVIAAGTVDYLMTGHTSPLGLLTGGWVGGLAANGWGLTGAAIGMAGVLALPSTSDSNSGYWLALLSVLLFVLAVDRERRRQITSWLRDEWRDLAESAVWLLLMPFAILLWTIFASFVVGLIAWLFFGGGPVG